VPIGLFVPSGGEKKRKKIENRVVFPLIIWYGNLDYNYALNYGQYYLIILRVRQLRETGQLHPSGVKLHIKMFFVMLHESIKAHTLKLHKGLLLLGVV
jgi:hypothetical protein